MSTEQLSSTVKQQATCITERDIQRDREWVSSVLRPHQHSIGYTGHGKETETDNMM